jgi:hypothetical protein
MMRGIVEPFVVPMVVRIAKQTAKVPQMTFPQEIQLKKQRHEVPHMTSS